MSFSSEVLSNDERAIYSLRELYRKHGYSHYKISKFEEYDLYVHNKNFLVSENILSFTDTNGKLMALKPDVTLSIVKNIAADNSSLNKVYYNEHVYRTSAENNGFREIMQTGLECIGNIDVFSECEVIMLAMKSLGSISHNYLLDISHMGLVEGMIESAGISEEYTNDILKLMSAKNIPAIRAFCASCGVSSEMTDNICELTEMYLPIRAAIKKANGMRWGEKAGRALAELEKIADAMESYGIGDKLYLDLSVINDMSYYDGVIFNGFIKGIPDSVLSGGRYDRLLSRLGKGMSAIGFAVYLDKLERFENVDPGYDVDIMLTYDSNVELNTVINTVEKLVSEGNTVRTVTEADKSLRYRKHIRVTEGGVNTIENND